MADVAEMEKIVNDPTRGPVEAAPLEPKLCRSGQRSQRERYRRRNRDRRQHQSNQFRPGHCHTIHSALR
jgi:hypothetical protein